MKYIHSVLILTALQIQNPVESQYFDPDPDCSIEERHGWLYGRPHAEIALIVDASKSMEEYRLALFKNFAPIFNGANNEFKRKAQKEAKPHTDSHTQIVMSLAYTSNGCFNLAYYNKRFKAGYRPDNATIPKFIEAFETKIKTHENAPSGAENALVAAYEAAGFYKWVTHNCTTVPFCDFKYILLFTGSGFDSQAKNCSGVMAPSISAIKKRLNEKLKYGKFRLMGFFPTEDLVQEYAGLAKELDLIY